MDGARPLGSIRSEFEKKMYIYIILKFNPILSGEIKTYSAVISKIASGSSVFNVDEALLTLEAPRSFGPLFLCI